jgi:hypothetical protein
VKVHRSFVDLFLLSSGIRFQDVAKAGLKFGDEGISQKFEILFLLISVFRP